MTIQKVFRKTIDEEVHSDFLKFGRGEYRDRFLLEAKKQAKGWTIKSGPEYVNYLVKTCLEKISGKVAVSGIIVSTTDLSGELTFDIVKVSNFQGVRKIQIDAEVEAEELLRMIEKYPRVFFALTFSGETFMLKVKAKAPKSGKPGKESEDGPKAEFVMLKTNNEEIVKELFFDVPEFKEVKITHTIFVDSIVYPEKIDSLKPAEIRELSKRKGRVIRKVRVDGTEKIVEAEFVA